MSNSGGDNVEAITVYVTEDCTGMVSGRIEFSGPVGSGGEYDEHDPGIQGCTGFPFISAGSGDGLSVAADGYRGQGSTGRGTGASFEDTASGEYSTGVGRGGDGDEGLFCGIGIGVRMKFFFLWEIKV